MSTVRNIQNALVNDRRIHEPLRASLRYLVVAPAAHLLASEIGSLSEYRFPLTLLTTAFHLALALATLLIASLIARLALNSRRLNSARSRLLRPSASASVSPFASTSLGSLLSALAHARPRRAHLSPLALAASLASALAALLQAHATAVSSTAFWSGARLLPLGLAVALGALGYAPAAGGRGARRWPWAAGLGVLLVTGPGLEWTASGEAYVCAVGYALGSLGWVWMVRAGQAEAEANAGVAVAGGEGEGGMPAGPSLGAHLLLSSGVLVVPLLLSHELGRASASGHFGFFTEAGFWAQEWGIAACGLASLAAFWGLITHLSPLGALSVVALKDFALPSAYAFWLGNSLDGGDKGPVLTRTQQWIGLAVLGAWTVAELVVEAGAPPGQLRKEAGGVKEG